MHIEYERDALTIWLLHHAIKFAHISESKNSAQDPHWQVSMISQIVGNVRIGRMRSDLTLHARNKRGDMLPGISASSIKIFIKQIIVVSVLFGNSI